jgi:hypothetical protein
VVSWNPKIIWWDFDQGETLNRTTSVLWS